MVRLCTAKIHPWIHFLSGSARPDLTSTLYPTEKGSFPDRNFNSSLLLTQGIKPPDRGRPAPGYLTHPVSWVPLRIFSPKIPVTHVEAFELFSSSKACMVLQQGFLFMASSLMSDFVFLLLDLAFFSYINYLDYGFSSIDSSPIHPFLSVITK